jgi:putative flippase GtrA
MRPIRRQPSAIRRWIRFNMVGLLGLAVQLALLKVLLSVAKLDYRIATLIAIEITVLHNFCWHVRFTWRERRLRALRLIVRRLLQFHLTNGVVSLAASWTLMSLLVAKAGLPVLGANLVCIVACSLINFLLAELVVFRNGSNFRQTRRRGAARLLLLEG